MRVLVTVFALHLLSTLPTMAGEPPAILGAIDKTDVQPLSNPEEVRGEYFHYDTLLYGRALTNMLTQARAAVFCSFNRCTGQTGGVSEQIGVTTERWVGFYAVEYRINNSIRWQSY